MSKIPFIVQIDETICSCLNDVRTMSKTGDYSRLPAIVENIQQHASKMESALWKYHDIYFFLERTGGEKKLSDKDFRKDTMEFLEKFKK